MPAKIGPQVRRTDPFSNPSRQRRNQLRRQKRAGGQLNGIILRGSQSMIVRCALGVSFVGCLLFTWLFTAAVARSDQPGDPWIGQKVMPREGCKLKVGEKPLDDKSNTLPYVVQNVNGSWFWVGNRSPGWVDRRDVVPLVAAGDYYTDLIRRKPDSAWAYASRATAWKEQGNFDKAIDDDTASIRIDPSDSMAYYNRGNAWLAKGEFDKALEDLNEAIRLDPTNPLALQNRGALWKRKNEYGKAIQDFTAVIRLKPNSGVAYNELAYLWATCPNANFRDGKRAVESAMKACQLTNWVSPEAIDTLAAACAETGDFDSAIRWEQRAISIAAGRKDLPVYQKTLAYFKDHTAVRMSPR
jgi:tetratricopeptide (TPR) repeat protein